MCSGRVKDKFVLHAFKLCAAIVLVSGCHFADCHYIDANRWTQKRVEKLWDKLEKLGIRPERLQLEWVSAAEGQKWAKVMKAVEEMRQKVTKEEVEFTMKALSEAEKPKAPKPAKKKAVAAPVPA
jgi:heterodisulfide reductase subunit A